MPYISKLTNEGGVKSLNRYVSMLAGNTTFVPTSYDSIATVTVGAGGATNINFSSIPQTYTHLQLRLITRNIGAEVVGEAYTTVNGASTGYNNHVMLGDGTNVTAGGGSYTTVMYMSKGLGASATASAFGVTIIDILDYSNTNKYKTLRTLSGADSNGTGFVMFGSGLWQSTAGINQVTYRNNYNLAQYSTAALYGIV
jgi:hypothetical protein